MKSHSVTIHDKIKTKLLTAFEDPNASKDCRFSNISTTDPLLIARGQFCFHLFVTRKQTADTLKILVDDFLCSKATPLVRVVFTPRKLLINRGENCDIQLFFTLAAEQSVNQQRQILNALRELGQKLEANSISYCQSKYPDDIEDDLAATQIPLDIAVKNNKVRFYYSSLPQEINSANFLIKHHFKRTTTPHFAVLFQDENQKAQSSTAMLHKQTPT